MNELHLFAGAGGGILGGILLGHTPVCAVEIEPYCRKVLLQRQRDGILPKFPIWDNVTTFDGKHWRGKVDVVAGGFPCQDISIGNSNGAGIAGERSGLWKEMARIIGEIRPRYCFVENSPMLTIRGLNRVLGDLSSMGYNAKWGVVGTCDVGGNNKRLRMWIVANLPDSLREGYKSKREGRTSKKGKSYGHASKCSWWSSSPPLERVANGVAYRMDRLKAIGNGQVPLVAATAWRILGGE